MVKSLLTVQVLGMQGPLPYLINPSLVLMQRTLFVAARHHRLETISTVRLYDAMDQVAAVTKTTIEYRYHSGLALGKLDPQTLKQADNPVLPSPRCM